MTRSYGYRPDPPDGRDWNAVALLAAHATDSDTPADTRLDEFATVLDQGVTNGCVGCATTSAIALRATMLGYALAPVSWLAAYTLARAKGGLLPLTDTGSNPRAAFAAMNEFGFVAEDRWPSVEGSVNSVIPWDVWRAGSDALLSGYYRIDYEGDFRLEAIRRALAIGYPVTFAMPVDESYEKLRPGETYAGLSDSVLGWHYQCLVGYEPERFRVLGSWGKEFADDGFAWVSDAWMASLQVSDLYAVTLSPRIVR